MVPTVFVALAELPRSPNGKVDRAALPVPSGDRPDLADEFVAPRDPGEELIAEIWGEVLGLDRVGVYDNFFDAGGQSLLATRVVARMNTLFDIELPLADLFDRPTVAGLAETVKDRILAELDRMSEDEVLQSLRNPPRSGRVDEDGATR
jgi:acyl carrier protein